MKNLLILLLIGFISISEAQKIKYGNFSPQLKSDLKDTTRSIVSDSILYEKISSEPGKWKTNTYYLIEDSIAVSGRDTIPATTKLKITNGGKIYIANTDTLVINGYIDAADEQIFNITGTGDIQGRVQNKEVFVKWFGTEGLSMRNAVEISKERIVWTDGDYNLTHDILIDSIRYIYISEGANIISSGGIIFDYSDSLLIQTKKLYGAFLRVTSDDVVIESYGIINTNNSDQTPRMAGFWLDNIDNFEIFGNTEFKATFDGVTVDSCTNSSIGGISVVDPVSGRNAGINVIYSTNISIDDAYGNNYEEVCDIQLENNNIRVRNIMGVDMQEAVVEVNNSLNVQLDLIQGTDCKSVIHLNDYDASATKNHNIQIGKASGNYTKDLTGTDMEDAIPFDFERGILVTADNLSVYADTNAAGLDKFLNSTVDVADITITIFGEDSCLKAADEGLLKFNGTTDTSVVKLSANISYFAENNAIFLRTSGGPTELFVRDLTLESRSGLGYPIVVTTGKVDIYGWHLENFSAQQDLNTITFTHFIPHYDSIPDVLTSKGSIIFDKSDNLLKYYNGSKIDTLSVE